MRTAPADVLTRALREGDREAFDAVCAAARPGLTAICSAIAGREAAEDVVQEVLLKIWLRRGRFDPARSAFSTWATTIARNTAIDHLRAAANRELLAETLQSHPRLPADGHHEGMVAADARRSVRAAAAALPADQRHALFDAFWLDRSHSEVAASRGVPLGTVKSRIRMGMTRMRSSLEEVAVVRPAPARP